MKKNSLKFLSLALVMFFIIASGGCGGGGSGGSGNSDTLMQESLKAQTFKSAENVTAKAKDASGNSVDITISDLEVTFDSVTTAAASVQAASTRAKVTVSYKMTVGDDTTPLRYHKTGNVEVSETSSGVYAFQFDGLSLTVDPASNEITCSGTFKPTNSNSSTSSNTEYTVSEPIQIPVTKESVQAEPEIPSNSVTEESSAARAETVLNLDLANLTSANSISFDADSVRGLPDFLDFYGIPQFHVNTSASKGVSVPSMVWLNKLYTESEGGNVLLVPLTEGQEYTFEVSKNFTEDLGGILPDISFYDPSNSINYLDEAKEIENVTIAAYPKENPSIICYTITPEVSGNYIVKITNGDPYLGLSLNLTGDNLKNATLETDSDEESSTGCVLFIYKERRNEKDETGYYTNFKFKVGDKTTNSISINDIIELRKMFLELYPDYFDKVYGQNLADDSLGMGYDFDWADFDKTYFDNRGYSAGQKKEFEEGLFRGLCRFHGRSACQYRRCG